MKNSRWKYEKDNCFGNSHDIYLHECMGSAHANNTAYSGIPGNYGTFTDIQHRSSSGFREQPGANDHNSILC
jgi:hypothetical protein